MSHPGLIGVQGPPGVFAGEVMAVDEQTAAAVRAACGVSDGDILVADEEMLPRVPFPSEMLWEDKRAALTEGHVCAMKEVRVVDCSIDAPWLSVCLVCEWEGAPWQHSHVTWPAVCPACGHKAVELSEPGDVQVFGEKTT